MLNQIHLASFLLDQCNHYFKNTIDPQNMLKLAISLNGRINYGIKGVTIIVGSQLFPTLKAKNELYWFKNEFFLLLLFDRNQQVDFLNQNNVNSFSILVSLAIFSSFNHFQVQISLIINKKAVLKERFFKFIYNSLWINI